MIDTAKVQDWLQIIGTFGVIASLMFVGLQMRQTHDIALSTTYQNRTATAIDTNIGSINSPELLLGVSKIYLDRASELTMPEAVALEWYVGSVLMMIENNHLQYQAGYLSEEHWQRNLNEMRCTLSVPLFREVAEDWTFRKSFAAVVETVRQEISADTEKCWAGSYGYALN